VTILLKMEAVVRQAQRNDVWPGTVMAATSLGRERKNPNSIPTPVEAGQGQMYWGQLASNPVDPVNPVKMRWETGFLGMNLPDALDSWQLQPFEI